MEEPKKIFFITSNQSQLNTLIKYNLPRKKGLINLRAGESFSEFQEEQEYDNSTFTVYVNSIKIESKDLEKDDQDPTTNKYNAMINLRYNKIFFLGNISFEASKNNFIYDFKFNEYKGWGKVYDPPPQINLSQIDQLKLYIKYLKSIKKLKKDEIYQDLISDSQAVCFGNKIYLDFFLEIFKNCYAFNTVNLFLRNFKLEKIILPEV